MYSEAPYLRFGDCKLTEQVWGDKRVAFIESQNTGAEVGRENARLIAAAPDLLAACKAALVWVALATGRDPETTHPQALSNAQKDLVSVKAAIAKAEGE